jgi:hypothetical protein
MIDESGSSPQIRNAATGAIVAQIQVPGLASAKHRRIISALATADGRTYVVSVYRSYPCQTWLYQFTLNSQGYPAALMPFPALPTIPGAVVYDMSISGNGRVLAFTSVSSGPSCAAKPQGPSRIGVANVVTGQTKQWVVSRTDSVNNVSLTANGDLLLYSLQESTSEVRVIATSAQPGMASERGRTVIKAAQLGPSTWISFAAISPNGKSVYFSTFPPGGGGPGQIRVTDLAGRRPKILAGGAYSPGLITTDPTVHHLRLYLHHKLSVLDLTTGKVTHLPAAWRFFVSEIIC